MGKKSFAGAFVLVGLVACGGNRRQPVNAYVDDGSVARASIESDGCGARATLIELPEHCRWPESVRRSSVLALSANVIVDVDADGNVRGARAADGKANESEAQDAVVACAMQGRYRAAWNGAGETCPLTIRLTRYPSDVASPSRGSAMATTQCSGGSIMYAPGAGGIAPDRGTQDCAEWPSR